MDFALVAVRYLVASTQSAAMLIPFLALYLAHTYAEQVVFNQPKQSDFHPASYTKSVAKCLGVNRQTNTKETLDIGKYASMTS